MGYHAYIDIWTPSVANCLLLMQEKTNVCDKYAIAVVLPNKTVVGHIPYDLAQIFSQFLRKGFNKDTVKVTGEKVNCGAGYGQEIPCVYMLYGPTAYTERVHEKYFARKKHWSVMCHYHVLDSCLLA